MPIASLTAAVLLAALAVALGFHRYRPAQFALLLLLFAGAFALEQPRWQWGAQGFVPLLAVLSAALPEGRLLSRRHALWLAGVLLLLGTTLDAPERLLQSMVDAAAGPFADGTRPDHAAPGFGLAAALCLLRWALRGLPTDLGSALALLAALLASLLPTWHANLMLAAGLLLLFGVLYGSYRMAFLDQLTGLPNRRALDETLGRLSGEYRLAMLDVDHFKNFNDSHGHDAGDVVLREVARQLARHAGGKAFRYGGEEFCVVYPGSARDQAAEGLERVRSAIEQRRIAIRGNAKASAAGKPKEKQVAVTISAGCAARDRERRQAAEVLKAADQALYKAKKKGRNQVVMA